MRCAILVEAILTLTLSAIQIGAIPLARPQIPSTPASESQFKRAAYSVVAVDGADGPSGPASPTRLSADPKAAPITKTIIETELETLPAITDVVISTQVINGPERTQTIAVTVTAPGRDPTADVDGYPVVNVALPPTTAPSYKSTTAIISTLSTSSTLPSSSPSAPPAPTATSVCLDSIDASDSELADTHDQPEYIEGQITSTQITPPPPPPPKFSLALEVSSTSTSTAPTTTLPIKVAIDDQWRTSVKLSTSSTASSSYDDGQWHTIYPIWSNTTMTQVTGSKAMQTATKLKHRYALTNGGE